ncbi:FMN-binding protein [Ancylomarina longa]|nr:FMN-binding protein [Ancylomarina longa]
MIYCRRFLLSFVLCFSITVTIASDYPKSIQKKIDKALKSAFDTDQVIMEELDISNFDSLNKENVVRNIKLSKLKSGKDIIGVAAFASSKGKFDYFDYLVLFDQDLQIRKIAVLIYRSTYGGEIMAKYWLKQFEGKKNGEGMVFEKDIDSISGATISGPSITKGIQKLSELMSELRKKGEI